MPARDNDRGAAALIKRMQAAARKKGVRVGVFAGDAQAEGELTTTDVAGFAEFGTADAPARPWLAPWVDENVTANKQRLRQIGEAVLRGELPSVEVGLARFGLFAAGSMQQRIRHGIPPPNAPSTIEKKGSSTPLIDTGQFWSSITFQVDE